MNILLTGVGGPTPRGIATALLRYGRRRDYRIIGTDTNPYARGLYETSLFDRTHVVPRAHDPDYWPAIVQLVHDEAIEIALVQSEDEVEVWAHRQDSNDVPCVAFVPPYPMVMACRDKGSLSRILEPLRLAPLTIPVRGSDQKGMAAAVEEVGLPCWVRSPVGASGLGACRLINDETIADVSEKAVRRVAYESGVEPSGLFTVDLKESADGRAHYPTRADAARPQP